VCTFVCTFIEGGAGDHRGYPHYIGVFGGFEAVLVWKLDGF
jgi:hypothetical protein